MCHVLIGGVDVQKVGIVKCDVSTKSDHDLRSPSSRSGQGNLDIGPFRCHLQLSTTCLDVEILHKKEVLARCRIPIKAAGGDSPS